MIVIVANYSTVAGYVPPSRLTFLVSNGEQLLDNALTAERGRNRNVSLTHSIVEEPQRCP